MKNGLKYAFLAASLAMMAGFAGAQTDSRQHTRFGTYAYFRASTGHPSFIDGLVYSPVDVLNRAKDKQYNPITPDGTPAPMSDDSKVLALTQPDAATRPWWIYQVKQMEEAGLDFVILDTMGMRNHRPVCDDIVKYPNKDPRRDPFQPDFSAKALSNVLSDPKVAAHLKVGLIIEGGPAYRAYNWNRMGNQAQTLCPNPFNIFKDKEALKNGTIIPMPITVENIDRYYYDLDIKPFFDHLDRNLWLTHNSQPVDAGGMPVIVVYNVNEEELSGFQNSGAAWAAVKAHFKRDYGVEPFLIMSKHWFAHGAGDDLKQLSGGMNEFVGEWIKGPNNPPINSWELNGYRVASVSPGIKAELGHWGGKVDYVLGKRWTYVDGTEGNDESYFLKREWQNAMKTRPDLVMFGHLDDFTEGQQFTRMANYQKKKPNGPDDYLPSDYYIKTIRGLIDEYHNQQ